eukprot:6460371-Amphidinium_carterae.2
MAALRSRPSVWSQELNGVSDEAYQAGLWAASSMQFICAHMHSSSALWIRLFGLVLQDLIFKIGCEVGARTVWLINCLPTTRKETCTLKVLGGSAPVAPPSVKAASLDIEPFCLKPRKMVPRSWWTLSLVVEFVF